MGPRKNRDRRKRKLAKKSQERKEEPHGNSLRIQPPLTRSRYYVLNAKPVGSDERRLYSQATWETVLPTLSKQLSHLPHVLSLRYSLQTLVSNFYGENNFKPCLTKQPLNVFKFWCNWNTTLRYLKYIIS